MALPLAPVTPQAMSPDPVSSLATQIRLAMAWQQRLAAASVIPAQFHLGMHLVMRLGMGMHLGMGMYLGMGYFHRLAQGSGSGMRLR